MEDGDKPRQHQEERSGISNNREATTIHGKFSEHLLLCLTLTYSCYPQSSSMWCYQFPFDRWRKLRLRGVVMDPRRQDSFISLPRFLTSTLHLRHFPLPAHCQPSPKHPVHPPGRHCAIVVMRADSGVRPPESESRPSNARSPTS